MPAPSSIPALASQLSAPEWRAGASGVRLMTYLGVDPVTPAVGVVAPDLDLRYAAAGVGPLVAAVVSAPSWQEVSPADLPGWYSLELDPAWIQSVGPWLARLAPVSGAPVPFEPVMLSGSVAPLSLTDLQVLTVRALGLLQENYVLRSHVYDPRGNLLSAEVALYANPADVSDPMAVPVDLYAMTATYDQQGRLTRYAVVKV